MNVTTARRITFLFIGILVVVLVWLLLQVNAGEAAQPFLVFLPLVQHDTGVYVGTLEAPQPEPQCDGPVSFCAEPPIPTATPTPQIGEAATAIATETPWGPCWLCDHWDEWTPEPCAGPLLTPPAGVVIPTCVP